MPAADQILNGLKEIANDWKAISILWHIYFGVFAVVIAIGYHPSRRLAGVLLGFPFLSVSASAWLLPNPVNGVIFAVIGILLLIIAIKLPIDRVRIIPQCSLIIGALLFAFGCFYPHFLDTTSYLPYMYAALIGTIHCSTLIIVIGAALIWDGLGSRTWCAILCFAGLLYGIMGIVYLHVPLVWALIFAAGFLLAYAFTRKGTTNEFACDYRQIAG
jgi:hypothetical protein